MTLLSAVAADRTSFVGAALRAGQCISAALGVTQIFVPPEVSGWSCALCLGAFLWFTATRAACGRVGAVLVQVTPWLALLIPALIIVAVSQTVGPERAFSIWLPPLMTALMLAFSMLRFQVWRPLAYSAFVALTYTVVYLFLTRDIGANALEASIDLSRSTLFHRIVNILLTGVGFAVVTRGLQATIEEAEAQTRQRDLFGKYRLGAPIASGGMASVVRASYCPDGGFERPVAIKRIHPHLAEQARFVSAFRREAEIGARLTHPNIVGVLDFGRVGDTWFLAMEHVDGSDLRALLRQLARKRRRMPPKLAGLIAHEVLVGLAFAHGGARDAEGRLLRVVHRDLSPGNVMIAKTGDVKITDFGIAHALQEAEAYKTKHLIGSYAYLSPEQATGAAFDERADLFAVGVLLWEMLACRRLWRRENEPKTLLAILNDEPPACRAPVAWDVLLRRALAKDPAQRFASARQFADAVASLVQMEHGGLPHPDELADFVAGLERKPSHDDIITIVDPPRHDDVLADADLDDADVAHGETETTLNTMRLVA